MAIGGTMEREEAIRKLSTIKGEDLRRLADKYEVTVSKEGGGLNKGWIGHFATMIDDPSECTAAD